MPGPLSSTRRQSPKSLVSSDDDDSQPEVSVESLKKGVAIHCSDRDGL